MKSPFKDAVVWITGGGSGIGRALALEFGRHGARVAVSGRRKEPLVEVVDELRGRGIEAFAAPCDVGSTEDVTATVATIVERWSRLDVAVANAGYAVAGAFELLSEQEWERQLNINVLGLVRTARAALPELRRTAGRIVLMGSVSAFVSAPNLAPYNASKAAVRAIGDTLSAELSGTGVTCTTVHPGYVKSDIEKVDNLGVHHPDREDRRPKFLLWESDDAARVIVRAVGRRKREFVFTRHGKAAVGLARHLPQLVQRALSGKPTRAPADGPARPIPLTATKPPLVLPDVPSTLQAFSRGLRVAAGRVQGVLDPTDCEPLPRIAVEVRDFRPSLERLSRYVAVTAFEGPEGVLPPAFPECFFNGLMGAIVCDERFPLSPLGLIHIGQNIRQNRWLTSDEVLRLLCHLTEARSTPKGIELDMAMEIRAGSDEPDWVGMATLLSRNPSIRAGTGRKKSSPDRAEHERCRDLEVRKDTGRRFAAATGDYNPHHLWPITAKPLGYQRPIAHGMWTLGRCLSWLGTEYQLTETIEVDAEFRKPILMPNNIQLYADGENDSMRFGALDSKKGSPYLTGTVKL